MRIVANPLSSDLLRRHLNVNPLSNSPCGLLLNVEKKQMICSRTLNISDTLLVQHVVIVFEKYTPKLIAKYPFTLINFQINQVDLERLMPSRLP